jgi:hypothetical protein
MDAIDSRDCAEIDKISDVRNPFTRHQFECHIRRKDTVGTLVVHDHAILAYCLYRFEPHGIRLIRICVDPWHRRKRIGMGLMNRVRLKCGYVTHPGGPGKVSALVRETDYELVRFMSKCEGNARLVRGIFSSEGMTEGNCAYGDIDGYRFAFDPIHAHAEQEVQ